MVKNKCCERCGNIDLKGLIVHEFEDNFGEKRKIKLCWDCDWEITNGRGDYLDDVGEIQDEREEQEYFDDPINNPKPSWM